EKCPSLKGWADERPKSVEVASEDEIVKIISSLLAKKPDYLFVAYGMGKQEEFIFQHLDQVKGRVAMGIGGAIDFWARRLDRAGQEWQKRGGEWLFRLLHQPWRWRRQFNLARFVWLVLRG
ncbi:WecB/TagA/CpsF family glycosyltransferase, partial [Patescibacteria group bacterium]|nr:WecB/TagA/CpsF family glycosyltransferase [Patescibacteria group bacterium]